MANNEDKETVKYVNFGRYEEKGNGESSEKDPENGGDKEDLSKKGRENAAKTVLPAYMLPIKTVGGSKLKRTGETAKLVAAGNGEVPVIEFISSRLGNDDDFDWFYKNGSAYKAEAKKTNEVAALRKLAPPELVKKLEDGIREELLDIQKRSGNEIIRTHTPMLQLLLGVLTGIPYEHDVPSGAHFTAKYTTWENGRCFAKIVAGRDIKRVSDFFGNEYELDDPDREN